MRLKAKRKYTKHIKPTVEEPLLKAIDMQVGGEHYMNMALQPIEFILHNDMGYIEGRVVEYMARWKAKGGIVDLHKSRHLLDIAIEFYEERATEEDE